MDEARKNPGGRVLHAAPSPRPGSERSWFIDAFSEPWQ
ncbi:hypothetical protein PXO_04468 [Xanthomonas oryzae pv. oryzae PXO99A]|uniref:Uncharacterized protein n=1 Tax=Xanthomonas oryzae pv. oryzae (strain PXO99A) TaxID=360094 RepID=A0A0K0GI21_XANOP|nr:hypothetical protein PXO_04468 [Xanthomonas oryzae pv. oryzae PXO99A]